MELAKTHKASSALVPYCRKQHHVDVILLPVVDPSDGKTTTALRFIAFGGKGKVGHESPTMMNDVWALHVTNTDFTWTQLHPEGQLPLPRWKFGGSVVSYGDSPGYAIYGGDCETDGVSNFLDDLWVFQAGEEPGEGAWEELKGRGHGPDKRRGHATVFTANGTLLLQGGKVSDSGVDSSPDLFSLELNDSSKKWEKQAPLPAESRWGHTLTNIESPGLQKHFNVSSAAVLYGGRRYDEKLDEFIYYSDLYAWFPQSRKWELIVPAPGTSKKNTTAPTVIPTARDHHSAAYVSELDTLFVYGGRYTELLAPPLSDVWGFSFKDLRWRQLSTRGDVPTARFGHDMAVWRGGAGDGEPALVAFGGESISRWGRDSLLNDVWMLDPKRATWRQVSRSDCNPGATGQIALPFVDVEAFMVLTGIVVFVGIGLCAHHLWRSFRRPRGINAYQAV